MIVVEEKRRPHDEGIQSRRTDLIDQKYTTKIVLNIYITNQVSVQGASSSSSTNVSRRCSGK